MNELEQKAREIADKILNKGCDNPSECFGWPYKAALEALQLKQKRIDELELDLEVRLDFLRLRCEEIQSLQSKLKESEATIEELRALYLDSQLKNAEIEERCERLESVLKSIDYYLDKDGGRSGAWLHNALVSGLHKRIKQTLTETKGGCDE